MSRAYGLLDIDLPCEDEGAMPSLRLGWRDDRDDVAHLPLPVADVVESGGVRVTAARTAGSQEAFGLHFCKGCPVRPPPPEGQFGCPVPGCGCSGSMGGYPASMGSGMAPSLLSGGPVGNSGIA